MSVSQFKQYEKCEVKGKAGFVNGPSDAMLFGSYVDAYVEGTLEQFKAENPEMISSRGATKGQLKATFKQADDICQYIDNDPIFSKFMSGDKQTIMTGEIGGVPFKIKMDSYSKGIAINDLKVMWKITDSNGEFFDFLTPYGYDVQMACYQEIVRQNTDEQLPCYICAVAKQTPINSVIVHVPQHVLDRALYRVESQIARMYEVKMGYSEAVGCGVCDECISNRSKTPIISFDDLI